MAASSGRYPNGTLFGQLVGVREGSLDFIIDGKPPPESEASEIDKKGLMPFVYTKLLKEVPLEFVIVCLAPEALPPYYNLIAPFDLYTWIAVIATIPFVSVFYFVIGSTYSRTGMLMEEKRTWYDVSFITFGVFFAEGVPETWKSEGKARMIVTYIYHLAVMFVISIFLCNLRYASKKKSLY